jgi:hypothetical protein
MKAPMSELVKRMLSDRKLAKRLMEAIQSERRNPDDLDARTIEVDGKKFRLGRVQVESSGMR